jgi:hypothetical protein
MKWLFFGILCAHSGLAVPAPDECEAIVLDRPRPTYGSSSDPPMPPSFNSALECARGLNMRAVRYLPLKAESSEWVGFGCTDRTALDGAKWTVDGILK